MGSNSGKKDKYRLREEDLCETRLEYLICTGSHHLNQKLAISIHQNSLKQSLVARNIATSSLLIPLFTERNQGFRNDMWHSG